MDYQFLKRENGYKPWLYRKKINGCRFLKRPYDALSILIYRTYKDVSNINHFKHYNLLNFFDLLIKGGYFDKRNASHN